MITFQVSPQGEAHMKQTGLMPMPNLVFLCISDHEDHSKISIRKDFSYIQYNFSRTDDMSLSAQYHHLQ